MEGAVTVNGRDVAGTPLWELAQTVGSVFQNPKSQFFNLDTTGEVLLWAWRAGAPLRRKCLGLWIRAARASAAWARSWTGISLPLSGGEKQRIACAGAWAMAPEVFVLDEPSSNLDGEGIRRLRDILKQLKAAEKNRPGWRSTACGTPPIWLTGCSICGKGGWSKLYTGAEFLTLAGRETALTRGLRELDGGCRCPEPPPPTAETGGLTVRGLRASCGGRAVWEDVSFTAPRGQITAITGHNGAGKTTLARCPVRFDEGAGRERSYGTEAPLGRKERRRKASFLTHAGT